jgi:hypothetical protein
MVALSWLNGLLYMYVLLVLGDGNPFCMGALCCNHLGETFLCVGARIFGTKYLRGGWNKKI